jgi:hypothetical protein
MLNKEDITIHFRSKIDSGLRERLERIFFFNWNQSRYAARITMSVQEYSKPVIEDEGDDEIALVFQDRSIGQTLHVFDSESPDAALIGVVMYERDSPEQITIIHLALHEQCREIFKKEKVNVAGVVIEELFLLFRKIKGVERVRIYYTNRTVKLKAVVPENLSVS